MEDPSKIPVTPIRLKPVPPKIDPKKFVLGENIEKLKNLIGDVDEFAQNVKRRGQQIENALDDFQKFVQKFGEVVSNADRMFKMKEALLEELLRRMNVKGGGSDGRTP